MLCDHVNELHALERKFADLEDEISRKKDAIMIALLSEHPEKAFSEAEVANALQEAGLDFRVKDAYPILARLANDTRIRREGLRYRAIQPDVLQRQLKETPPPPKPGVR